MCDHVQHTGKVDRLLVSLILGLSLAMLSTPAPAAAVDADLLLRGGTVHDGSGAEPVVGDVAIRDGRIVAVGKVTPGKIGRTIDCQGLVVAPGLIDLHTHTDGTLAQPGCRASLNYLMQGCTTMCTGNCGGAKDVAKFLDDVDANGAGTNIIHLVGHGTIRRAVMGSARSALTIAASYVVGGLVPLSPYFFLSSVHSALIASVVVTLIALLTFGYVKGRFTVKRPIRSAWQTVVVGGLAATAAFLLAKLIG